MKNDYLFHIGYPKSASSYIKRTYLDEFADMLVIPRGDKLNSFYESNSSLPFLGYTRKVQEKKIVISNESLAGRSFWDSNGYKIVAQNIKKNFPEAKILILTREQISYIQSGYKYSISKSQYLPKINDFFSENKKNILKKICYQEIISFYINLFGTQNVCVLPYEMMVLDQSTFIDKLSYFTGHQFIKQPNNTNITKNKSPESIEYVEFLRRINRYIGWVGTIEGKLSNLLYNNKLRKQNKKRHGYQAIAKILTIMFFNETKYKNISLKLDTESIKHIKKSNKKTSQLTGIDLKNYGYLV